MAQTEKDVETPVPGTEEAGAEGASSKVADYLAAPRKKRKSYVVMALGQTTQQDVAGSIESFLRSQFKNVAISMPRSIDELTKNFSRQIVLLVFDDEFTDLDKGLEILSELKRRRNTTTVPVLFLTRDPERLVSAYSAKLAPFHEVDDYVNYAKNGISHVLSKVKFGLTNMNKRRSRRYKIDMALSYFLLTDDKMHPGHLIDLSVHGTLLRADDDHLFRNGEQVKLHIPVNGILPPTHGDYLKLSGRVRRVFISGNQAGVSFEYVSAAQMLFLTTLLTSMVNDQNDRRALALKARAART